MQTCLAVENLCITYIIRLYLFWKGLSILYSSGSHSFIDTENSCHKIQHKSLNYLTISGFRSLTLGRKLYSYLVCHTFLWKARLDCPEELYWSLQCSMGGFLLLSKLIKLHLALEYVWSVTSHFATFEDCCLAKPRRRGAHFFLPHLDFVIYCGFLTFVIL